MADEQSTPAQPADTQLDDRGLQTKAARRSWICPGAGYALLGRGKLAVATVLASLGTLLAIIWLALEPGATALWVVLGGGVLSIVLWLAEQVAVKRLSPRTPSPRFLVGGFLWTSLATWLGTAAILVFLFSRFGSLQMAGSGMSPTLEKGERLLYEKRVEPAQLQRGAVILYQLPSGSAWGEPGFLVVSRVLAVPGDRLSIEGTNYLVNGQVSSAVGLTGQYAPVIQVPLAPSELTVPADCYFIVQDSPGNGFDSRILSWVEAKDIVSTRIYYLRGRSLLQPVS
jgi:signal peptidase I